MDVKNIDEILSLINEEIVNKIFSDDPKSLFDPIEYILSIGGKRVRPALALMSCNLYTNQIKRAMPAALALEIFHNFTLLHDDLMDNADLRRGNPTVHVKWNKNVAVLSGDAMLIEAYKEICLLDKVYLEKALALFSEMATQICCGQQFDMEFETKSDVTVDEYLHMIKLKTAVLLGTALELGALIGGAPEDDINLFYQLGIELGMGFQLKDDLLDTYGDPKIFGKKIGGDILSNKKTYLLVQALHADSTKKELAAWLEEGKSYDENEKISAVRSIYNSIGLKEKTEIAIRDFYNRAIQLLNQISVSKESKKQLYNFADSLTSRIS